MQALRLSWASFALSTVFAFGQTSVQQRSEGAGPAAHSFAAVDLNAAAGQAVLVLAAGTLAALAATLLCLAFGIRNGLDPGNVALIRDSFPSLPVTAFLPEPLERAQALAFIAGAYVMGLVLIRFPRLVRVSRPGSGLPAFSGRMYWTLLAIALIASLLFGQTAFGEPVRHFYAFLPAWLPRNPMLWYWTFVVTAAPILLHSTRLRQHLTGLLAAMSLVALVLLCARLSFVAPAAGLALDARNHHDSAALHSVVQSAFGQIPYIDFVPQYGGYGLFARPLFLLGLDPWFALCLFVFLCWLVSFGALVAAVAIASGSWRAGSLAGIVAFWLTSDAWSLASLYQHAPLRTLFPSVFLLLFSLYPRWPRSISALSGLIVPAAVYWNPESGLVCFAAASSILLLEIVAGRRPDRQSNEHRDGRSCLASFLAACLLAAAVLEGMALLSRGHAFPIADLGLHASLFSRHGYLNLPIPLLDVWLPAAGVFCLLLSFPAAMSSAASDVRDRALFGFSCAMLFAGLFFYYQGRSYTSNLVAFAFPLVCAGFSWLWTDSGTQSEAITPVLTRRNVPVLAFAIASAALIASPFTAAPFMNPLSLTVSHEDRALREFIRKESKQHDTAFIVSPQAWRLHLLSGVPPPIRIPPQSGLLTRLNEQDTLAAASPGSAHALFVDPQYFSPEVQMGSPFAQILLARISSGWQHEKTLKLKSGALAVVTPRTGPRGTPAPRAGARSAQSLQAGPIPDTAHRP